MKTNQVVILTFLVLIASGGYMFYLGHKKHSDKEDTISGIVQTTQIDFGSRQGGRVKEVYVSEGDFVREGDLILTLENMDLLSQRDSILSKIELQKSVITEMESGSRIQDIQIAVADIKVAQAQVERAKKTLERQRALFGERIVTKDAVEESQKAYKVVLEDLSRAELTHNKVQSGIRKETVDIEHQRLKVYQSELEQLNKRILELKVVSPCNCDLAEFTLKKGGLILPNEVLGTLIDMDNLWVDVYVPEAMLGKVSKGDTVGITSLSYPNEKFTGKVVFIGLKSEFTPRNLQTLESKKEQVFKLKISLDDRDRLFRPGMDLEVTFQ